MGTMKLPSPVPVVDVVVVEVLPELPLLAVADPALAAGAVLEPGVVDVVVDEPELPDDPPDGAVHDPDVPVDVAVVP